MGVNYHFPSLALKHHLYFLKRSLLVLTVRRHAVTAVNTLVGSLHAPASAASLSFTTSAWPPCRQADLPDFQGDQIPRSRVAKPKGTRGHSAL